MPQMFAGRAACAELLLEAGASVSLALRHMAGGGALADQVEQVLREQLLP